MNHTSLYIFDLKLNLIAIIIIFISVATQNILSTYTLLLSCKNQMPLWWSYTDNMFNRMQSVHTRKSHILYNTRHYTRQPLTRCYYTNNLMILNFDINFEKHIPCQDYFRFYQKILHHSCIKNEIMYEWKGKLESICCNMYCSVNPQSN